MRISATRTRASMLSSEYSLITRALRAIRRNNGSAWYVPDDYGLTLGPELSPTASTTAGWIMNNATLSSDGVNLTVTATVAFDPQARASFSTTVGKTYRVSATLVSSSAPNPKQIRIGTTLGGSEIFLHDPVTPLVRTFVATTTTTYLSVGNGETAIGQFSTFTNLSFREVLSTNIYTDSSGSMPVSAVGDVLGLLTDSSYGAGNFGPELGAVANWNGATGDTTINAGSGTFTTTSSSGFGSGANVSAFSGAIVSGKTYFVTYTVIFSTVGSGVRARVGGVDGQTVTASGTYTCQLVATGANPAVIYAVGAGSTFTVSNVSVREVLGNHATQATAANKPVITRVPRKLGPELVVNGDFSGGTAGWSLANGATISVGQLSLPNANATAIYSVTGQAGKNYWFSFDYISGSGTQFINVQSGSVVFGVATTTTARRYAVPVSAGVTDAIKIWQDGGASGSAVIDNISVREVLEWSNAMKFDGINDGMRFGSVPFQMNQDHFAICAFSYQTVKNQTILAPSGDTGSARFASIGVTSAGNLIVEWWDGTTYVNPGMPLSTNTPCVVTAVRRNGRLQVYVNGIQISDNAAYSTSITTTATMLGGGGLGSFDGWVTDAVFGQALLTEADRKTIERNMAQRAGVTYLG